MKRKRYTEEQIISILKEHEAGMKITELVRKHSVSTLLYLPTVEVPEKYVFLCLVSYGL